MTPSLWILLAPLGAGALVTLRAIVRDRDPRHAVSLGLLALLAMRHITSPPAALPPLDTALEAQAAPLLVDLAINLIAWLAASLTASSIRERNRAEELQWSSMEALRNLADRLHAPSDDSAALDQAQELLAYGCEHLRFETGLLVMHSASTVEVLVAEAPADVAGLEPGDCPALARSLAARCFESRDVVVVDHASSGPETTQPDQALFEWESLAGLRIAESGDSTLSIVFADRKRRTTRFGSVEKSLLTVMGRWLHARTEAEAARALVVAPAASAPFTAVAAAVASDDSDVNKSLTPTHARERAATDEAPPSAERLEPGARSGFDLNRGLRALEAKLRKGVARTHNFELTLAHQTPRVEFDQRALERVAMSLLLHAADTVPDDGQLELATGAIEAPEPDAPRFGTLTLKARGPALDADQLAALYEGRGDTDAGAAPRRLPLQRVVRLLRDAGGDLSLESEEGVGTTFTAFLAAHQQAGGTDTE